MQFVDRFVLKSMTYICLIINKFCSSSPGDSISILNWLSLFLFLLVVFFLFFFSNLMLKSTRLLVYNSYSKGYKAFVKKKKATRLNKKEES